MRWRPSAGTARASHEALGGIRNRFEIEDYDINIDGSAVVLYGPKSEYAAIGYGRDKKRGKMQVGFMVAQLAELGILIYIYIKPYRGNVSDEEQYWDCIPEVVGLLSENGLHPLDVMKVCTDVPEVDEDVLGAIAVVTLLGAAIVADNGAASDSNAKRIEKCGLSYVTRVEINKSDLRNIDEHASEFEYVGGGVQCYKHHLASSGRTTFLFLSRDLLEIGRHKARRRLEKVLGMYENVKNGNLRKSDYVRSQRCLRSAWMSL